jgi:predicted DsbA family dithiol-disulfide isomerase
MIDVLPGTIAIYSDIACPWAHLGVWRLWQARSDLHLEDAVRFDHRPFPLELINGRCPLKRALDSEIPVIAGLGSGAGWQVWQARAEEWPVTMLLALEAVQAAKQQGLAASEELDRALRLALFAESRCISMFQVICDVAEQCEAVDQVALAKALQLGTARSSLWEHEKPVEDGLVQASPHLWLADGTHAANPGIEMHWEGRHGKGYPVIDKDDPSVYQDLLQRAAATA